MGKIDNNIINEFNVIRHKPKFLCNAPFCNIEINYYGRVRPCCRSFDLVDSYKNKNLNEVWNGNIFKICRNKIKRSILPSSCSVCENRLNQKEFKSLKILEYDNLKISRFFYKPRRFEIEMSNICNLECIMCNETLSSSICRKKNIENHDDLTHKFYLDFKKYIPQLQEAIFLGGEPFLTPIYYNIWEDIIKINPKCSIGIITNGTILNDRIKKLLDKGNFNISVSFNGITKETYEAIHINGNYEETKTNILYFGEYMKKNNKTLTIPICPLKVNKFEIPDIIRFCNQNNFQIDILDVIGAVDVALFSSNEEDLIEIKRFYQNQKFDTTNNLCINNIAKYNDLILRIDHWIELAKQKKEFTNIFDLRTDNVNILKKQLFNNIENSLCYITTKKDSEFKIKHIYQKFENIINQMPDYFESNHLYKSILSLSPSLFTEYFLYCGEETLSRFIEEIFYYGLNHG